jgi:hypothetical protein
MTDRDLSSFRYWKTLTLPKRSIHPTIFVILIDGVDGYTLVLQPQPAGDLEPASAPSRRYSGTHSGWDLPRASARISRPARLISISPFVLILAPSAASMTAFEISS